MSEPIKLKHSNKITVTIDDELSDAIRHYAVDRRMTLNQAIGWIVQQHFSGTKYLIQGTKGGSDVE